MNVFDVNGNALSKAKIRICGFNVGNFAMGQSGTPAGNDELYNKFVDTFRKCKADIYMFSEWDVHWNNDELSSNVFSFLKPYHSVFCKDISGAYSGQMNYSAFPIIGEHYEDYSPNLSNYFIDNTIKINGKTLHIICTHITLNSKAEAMSEMQKLVQYISDNNITSYIIGGDMNLGLHKDDDIPQTLENRYAIAREEIALLETTGGESVQGSGWGLKNVYFLFNTVLHKGHNPEDNNIGPYDNFVISPDITLDNVELIITDASDHDALCIDVIL